uniref:Ubiquitin-conjugating enzyme E2 n=1 Tax=Clandestinovirus TaxID=2831644 RepID=A0A8F8KLF8_9VIRU|nr:ubiquitin-conjugating enzyme E2 [Clandestinovirus]
MSSRLKRIRQQIHLLDNTFIPNIEHSFEEDDMSCLITFDDHRIIIFFPMDFPLSEPVIHSLDDKMQKVCIEGWNPAMDLRTLVIHAKNQFEQDVSNE